MRATTLGLLLAGGLGMSMAAMPAAYADTPPLGSLHLHQSDDCSGPDLPSGSRVNVAFSIGLTGFVPNQIGVFTVASESGAISSNRISAGDTGTTCSVIQSVVEGGFLASFRYTDLLGEQQTASVAGVVSVGPVDPAPTDTDSPWATPTATAIPTSSPGTHPSHSPRPTKTRTTSTPLASTGGGSGSGSQLPTTGADPRLVLVALATTLTGVVLYVVSGLPRGRRQR